ncbi:MAG: hypothetical protein NUV49_03560 [Patescibacteria group bacterium]|nr:hypothetical protein [Patescibacteria group bacterium]
MKHFIIYLCIGVSVAIVLQCAAHMIGLDPFKLSTQLVACIIASIPAILVADKMGKEKSDDR